jgi:hypothetical protein
MNERIKDLFIKSEVFISNRDGARWEIDQDKFADLIIRECVAQMTNSYKFDPYTGKVPDYQYNSCIDDQVAILLEHFGVKE